MFHQTVVDPIRSGGTSLAFIVDCIKSFNWKDLFCTSVLSEVRTTLTSPLAPLWSDLECCTIVSGGGVIFVYPCMLVSNIPGDGQGMTIIPISILTVWANILPNIVLTLSHVLYFSYVTYARWPI